MTYCTDARHQRLYDVDPSRRSGMRVKTHLPAVLLTALVATLVGGALYVDYMKRENSFTAIANPVKQIEQSDHARALPPAPERLSSERVEGKPGVYRCLESGRTTYQEDPCPESATTFPLERGTLSIADAQPPHRPSHMPASRRSTHVQVSQTNDPTSGVRGCPVLVERKATIQREQRAGVSGQRMNRLTQDLQKVTDEMYELRCSGFR